MKQNAITWWNKQDGYTQQLLYYITFKRPMPEGGIFERQVENIYKSYGKYK